MTNGNFEQELLDGLKHGRLKRSKYAAREIKIAKEAALNYLKKDSRINIRLSSTDLNLIKRKAVQEGLPYQTLISSILHKYVTGHTLTPAMR